MLEGPLREWKRSGVAMEHATQRAFSAFDPDVEQVVVGVGLIAANVDYDRNVDFPGE